jgi:transcriptional regulator with XRE-family HTH domain
VRADRSPTLSVDARTIGERIRSERHRQELTLAQVAERSDLTISTLSQIERGLSDPTLNSLRSIAWALGIPMFQLVVSSPRPDSVVRRADRPTLRAPGGEIAYQRVTSDGASSFEVLAATILPGTADPAVSGGHPYEECVLVLGGQIEMEVAGERFSLDVGDSITIERDVPHRYINVGEADAEVLMILSPRPAR